jgi:hypothetical protein
MIIANLNNWGHSLAGHGQVLNLEFIKPSQAEAYGYGTILEEETPP